MPPTSAATAEATEATGGQPTGPTNDRGQSFTGRLQLAGDHAGTFTWHPDLAITTCLDNGIELTLTDGQDTFITLRTNTPDDTATIFSGIWPDSYSGPGAQLDAAWGGNIGDPISGTATFDPTLQASQGGGNLTVNGTLTFYCP